MLEPCVRAGFAAVLELAGVAYLDVDCGLVCYDLWKSIMLSIFLVLSYGCNEDACFEVELCCPECYVICEEFKLLTIHDIDLDATGFAWY